MQLGNDFGCGPGGTPRSGAGAGGTPRPGVTLTRKAAKTSRLAPAPTLTLLCISASTIRPEKSSRLFLQANKARCTPWEEQRGGAAGDVLRSYKWLLLECPPGIFLPTSDNPFVRARFSCEGGYMLDCGITDPDVYLLVPITPRHLLITKSRGETARNDLLENPGSRNYIMHAIVNNAHLYVYSKEKSSFVESARESIVYPLYLEKYEQNMKNWIGS